MCKEITATSVRMPEKLINAVDKFADLHSMNRTAAINYLLTQGLIKENFLKLDKD